MTSHSRSRAFWRFQFIFWGTAGTALFISGATQMPLLQAAVRNVFLFIAGFMTSFFLAMLIDLLRGLDALRTRLTAYSIAYIIALFCVVAINAIHLDHVPEFDYDHLWWERQLRNVANVTRTDVSDLVALAAEIPIRTRVEEFDLTDVNHALARLSAGTISGAVVLRMK